MGSPTFESQVSEEEWEAAIILYGSVSKPCTPGEHQNSW